MTYGEHEEAASQAILSLLASSTDGLDSSAGLLACRRQVHLALEERLGLLGIHRHPSQPVRLDRSVAAVKHPLRVLHTVLKQMPLAGPDLAPSDVLTGPPPAQASTLELGWRDLARHLALGNADLAGPSDATTRRRPATWYLIGDLATTVEALLVLDQQLSQAGHLRAASNRKVLETRIAVGDVARVAVWRGSDTSPDRDHAGFTQTPVGDGGPRIRTIHRPEDFAAAQRALANFLRPRGIDETTDAYGGRPGLQTARIISAGQSRLAEAFAVWAERAGVPELADRFRSRIPAFLELGDSTHRMIEVIKTRSLAVQHQQSEMVQQLRAHHASRLSRYALFDLEVATHELTINVGRTLRREGLARRNILVLDEALADQPRPIASSRDRFTRACRALADEPADPMVDLPERRPSRDQLADVLRTRSAYAHRPQLHHGR